MFPASWNSLRPDERLCILGAQFQDNFDDIRDDIASFLQNDRVTNAHIEPLDLVFVVESGTRDDRPGHGNRL